MREIPQRKDRREHLTDDRGHCRTHHAPFEYEDENGIEDDVNDGAGECGDHGEPGVSVRANDRVHSLPEHIERDAQRDIEEILLRVMESFFVNCAAEHSNNVVRKNEIYRRQDKTAGDA